ncbi:hypothetical protein AAF712_005690 [Marasmius tenuissimus]|uniref:BTB domain-containing protein n=1 Tax=Marasmius tenuissimus TaxID=585030 RepID=A0ABR3A013_9AGAR
MTANPNAKFFWELIIFKVEDELYKVPKHRFANNPYSPFTYIFTLPQTTTSSKGMSSDNPIVLEQISKIEFERFLGVLYDPQFYTINDDSSADTYAETWLSVLKLSSLWNFLDVRKIAIERIEKAVTGPSFTNIDRLLAGSRYGVLQLFIAGVFAIGRDPSYDIDLAGARRLGLERTVALFSLKGNFRKFDKEAEDGVIEREKALEGKRLAFIKLFADEIQHLLAMHQVYEPVSQSD